MGRRRAKDTPRQLLSVVIFLVLALSYPAPTAAIIWDDGAIHNVNSDLSPFDIYVYDNISPPYNPTVVNILDGASIYRLFSHENSFITSTGGYTGEIWAYDNSKVTIDGGITYSMDISGDSTLSIIGGDITKVGLYGNVHASIYGGNFSPLHSFDADGQSTVDIYNATDMGVLASRQNSTINVLDGQVFRAQSQDQGTMTILGGTFGEHRALGHSNMIISGGDINLLRALEQSTVEVYGISFDVPFGIYTASDNLLSLNGTLADGTLFSCPTDIQEGASLILAPVPETPPAYTVIDLGTIGEPNKGSYARAVNNQGQVAGHIWWYDELGGLERTTAFVWDSVNGMQELGNLGGQWAEAWDINDAGQVVGEAYDSSGRSHAVIWEDGGITDLGIGRANAINNSGQVAVGNQLGRNAFVWDRINGVQYLSGSDYIYPWGINDSGQVVGVAYNPDADNQAFIWDNVNGLQFLPQPSDYITNNAKDINNRGQVVGSAYSQVDVPVLWNYLNSVEVIGPRGGASGINDAGEIVGSVSYGGSYFGFLWDSAYGIRNINDLIINGYDFDPITGTVDINNAGQIVTAVRINNRSHAVLLTPVPENQPPVAVCEDTTVPSDPGVCTAAVASVDDGSYDPDGDPIALEQTPVGPYSLGNTDVTLTVTDDKDASDTCSATVEIVDQEPPVIENLVASPNTLWPANHKMVPVVVQALVADNCDSELSCQIISVAANEPKDTTPDWEITGYLTVELRAERSGSGDGRFYTITVQCADTAGNTSSATVDVAVPHDQGKGKRKK